MSTLLPNGPLRIVYLRTLGHPALLGPDGITVHKLRKKDLALLVYLCVEGTAVHSRERLATLLWGGSTIELARHSLTQALSRLGRLLPSGSLVLENQVVHWGEALPCDAVVLLRGGLEPEDVDAGFSIYEGEFLRGFHPGAGAEDFMEWADGRGADLRNAALRLLESAGADAEQKRQWWRAVKLAEKAVRIDPLFGAVAPARAAGNTVTFEPGARTAWHTHPLGQVLVVTMGLGLVQREGGPIEEIRPGDAVWFEPGEKHWHGASPATAMTHIAVQETLDGLSTDDLLWRPYDGANSIAWTLWHTARMEDAQIAPLAGTAPQPGRPSPPPVDLVAATAAAVRFFARPSIHFPASTRATMISDVS